MKQRKKIIQFSSYDDVLNPYYGGGGAATVHEVAKRLTNTYTVKVVTSRFSGCQDAEVIDQVQYTRIGYTPSYFPPLGQLLFQLLLPFEVMKDDFDLWIESFTPPFSTAFLPCFTHKKVIGLAHFLSGKEMSKKYFLPFHNLEKIGLQQYHTFITPTQVVKDQIMTVNPKATVTVISNGISIPKQVAVKRKKQVGYIGRIEIKQKGLDLLIQAFSMIDKKEGWKLVIAGSGPPQEMNILESEINNYHLHDSVRVLGRISGEAKEKFLQETAILAVPSRFETFCVSALEGLAYGIPLVGYDIEGLTWVPRDCIVGSPRYSITGLKNALHQLMTSSDRRRRMSLAGQKASYSYSWPTIIQTYRKVLQEHI